MPLKQGYRTAGVPHEITIYDGQPHAFVTDIESIRAGGVQGEAWAQMLAFLDENLKNGSSGQNGGSSILQCRIPLALLCHAGL